MTPGEIITLVKDLVILIVLALVVYFLVSYGKDLVKVSDMKAVQKQLDVNAKTQAQWAREAQDAEDQRKADMGTLSARIAAQRAPIIVRSGPASACSVSGPSAQTASTPATGGRVDPGTGRDIRSQINSLELKYEGSLADCRQALASWPQ